MLSLFLAEGFEEIEALTTLDILRRLGLEVTTVSITGKRLIHGAHNIPIIADSLFRRSVIEQSEGLILPGGMPGAKNLMIYEGLRKMLITHNKRGKLIAAICAAPMIIGRLGILEGRRATCYPGFESHLTGAKIVEDYVVEDNNIITAKGPAAAVDFAFTIAARFVNKDAIMKVKNDMLMHITEERD